MRSIPRRQIGLVAAAAIFAPLLALGHALLIESSPREGESLPAAAATQASLRFNGRLERKISRVNLVDAAGKTLKLPPPPDDNGDSPDRIVVALPAGLAPGSYYIEYRVMATDGHSTPGLVRFTITPPTSTTVPATQPVTSK